MLGDTPAMRIGLWPKRLLFYRAAEPFCSISEPLEVLCAGRQFVAFADHPDTGKPYQWPDASPADCRFLNCRRSIWPRFRVLGPAPALVCNSHVHGNGELSGTFEAIADALRFIANADLAYGTWIRIGMAIRGALGDPTAVPCSPTWSATSSKDVPATTEDAWSRFKPTRIGAGTIYHEARLGGWARCQRSHSIIWPARTQRRRCSIKSRRHQL